MAAGSAAVRMNIFYEDGSKESHLLPFGNIIFGTAEWHELVPEPEEENDNATTIQDRKPNHFVVLRSIAVSKRHFLLSVNRNGSLGCADLGSTNQTVIVRGGHVIQIRSGFLFPLQLGDQIFAADVECQLHSATETSQNTALFSPTMDQVLSHAVEDLDFCMPDDEEYLWIAKTSLETEKLPLWEKCQGPEGEIFYYNSSSCTKLLERPQNVLFRHLLREQKRRDVKSAFMGKVLQDKELPLLSFITVEGVETHFNLLPGENTVGKGADMSIVLPSQLVSKKHASLHLEGRSGRIFVVDHESTNETVLVVDGKCVTLNPGQEYLVRVGNLLVFGDVECQVQPPRAGGALGIFAQKLENDEQFVDGANDAIDLKEDGEEEEEEEESNRNHHYHDVVEDDDEDDEDGDGSADNDDNDGTGHIVKDYEDGNNNEEQFVSKEEGQPIVPSSDESLVDIDHHVTPMDTKNVGKAINDPILEFAATPIDVLNSVSMQKIIETPSIAVKTGKTSATVAINSNTVAVNSNRPDVKQSTSHCWSNAPRSDGSLWGRQLPVTIVNRILSHIPVRNLGRICCCSKTLRTHGENILLWKAVDFSNVRTRSRHLVNALTASKFSATTSLNFSGVRACNDEVLIAISKSCVQLKELSLRSNLDAGPQVTDSGLQQLVKACPQIEILDFTWCSQLGDSVALQVASCCKSLHFLSLSFCHRFTDRSIMSIATGCTKLQTLKLDGLEALTPKSVMEIGNHCEYLEHLSLAGCKAGATGAAVLTLANKCRLLLSLDCTSDHTINDAAIWQIARHCTHLETLRINWCNLITDLSMAQVAQFCHNLKSLEMRGCKAITERLLHKLGTSCSKLVYLDVRDCPNITDQHIREFRGMLPSCEVHCTR